MVSFDSLPIEELEAEVFVHCGAWKSIRDLEDSISIEELSEIYEGVVEIQNRQMRFNAALQGVDLAEDSPRQSGSSDILEVNGRKIPLNSDSNVYDVTTANSLAGLGGLGMASEPIPTPEIIYLDGNR